MKKKEEEEESTCHRLILCTEQDGGDGLCIFVNTCVMEQMDLFLHL